MHSAHDVQNHPYWGFWSSLGIGLLIFVFFSILQTLFLLAYSIYSVGGEVTDNLINSLNFLVLNGDALGFAEIPAALIGSSLILLFTSIPKINSIRDYLKIHLPTFSTALKWLAIMVLVIFILEGFNILLDRQTPDFMNKVYQNTDNYIVLWIAVIIGAPLFEELLFRGFLFESLLNSKAGFIGATLITAASWAIIHLQYGWYEIFTIFLIGVVLAYAKHRSQSLLIPFLMHMLMNLAASIMMEIS